MRNRFLAGMLLAAGAVLAGCAHGGAFVTYGPPPPRYGVIGVAPGPGYIWTDGFWDLRGGHWFWVQGRWMRPPRRGAAYVRPEWHREGNRWNFRHGYWR